ncbi:MAG: type II toxin-antitoxin system mRNA interferase toxin, RelE/StbE family [bacterium]|nr:type II toxin-antitoxin system mRNA interferase toxin, RelE/StbE family [bacterium]
MDIIVHKDFLKQYRKLTINQQKNFKKRRDLFVKNPFHPILKNHRLEGKFSGYHSINIAGDLRVIYKEINDKTVVFAAIGTHDQLYS